jgi:ABC-type phosphate transport system substrate-binding protein
MLKVIPRIIVGTLFVHAFLAMAAKEVLEIAGSGATNPSDCVINILDRLQIQSKLPIRMTYRPIGTGSGQEEFISADKVVEFAFSDVPLSQENFDEVSQREETLQLPFILGAVSFFHNVPNTPFLNLTSCIIAKIYRGDITSWDDPEIAAENPSLVLPPGGLAVRAIRRADSSGGTAAFSGYVATACPDVWPVENQGSAVEWTDVTIGCEGSVGVVQCVTESEGTIGYLATSHGHDALLTEAVLTNKDGTRLTSEEALLLGGIAAAATENSLPDSPDQFYPVQQFMNQVWRFVAGIYRGLKEPQMDGQDRYIHPIPSLALSSHI